MCWFLVLVCGWKICIILKTLGLKVVKVRGQPRCWDSTLKIVRNTTEAQFCREERPPTDKRSHSWSKDGAALDHEGHPGTNSHGHVSCQPPKRMRQVLLGEMHSIYSRVEKEPSHLHHHHTTFFMQSASDCFFRAASRCGHSAARRWRAHLCWWPCGWPWPRGLAGGSWAAWPGAADRSRGRAASPPGGSDPQPGPTARWTQTDVCLRGGRREGQNTVTEFHKRLHLCPKSHVSRPTKRRVLFHTRIELKPQKQRGTLAR